MVVPVYGIFGSGTIAPPAGPLTLSVSPTSASAGGYTGSGEINTGSVTVTASAGNGSYSYSWFISQSSFPGLFQINSPSSATTSFGINSDNTPSTGAFKFTAGCTVTDTAGNSGTIYINVSFNIQNNPSGGGGGQTQLP